MNLRALVASPIVVLILLGTRLLLVSNYEDTTATTIIRVGGVRDTALGVAIPLLPLLLPTVFVIFVIFRRIWAAAVTAVCSLLVAYTSHPNPSLTAIVDGSRATVRDYLGATWDTLRSVTDWHRFLYELQSLAEAQPGLTIVMSVAVVLAITGTRVNIDTGNVGRVRVGPLRRIVEAVAWPLIAGIGYSVAASIYPVPPTDGGVWSSTLRRMWLPPEVMTLKSGEVRVGYLLGKKDDWFVLLNEKDRTVSYVMPGDIKSRDACTLGEPKNRAPYWAIDEASAPSYDLCAPGTVKARVGIDFGPVVKGTTSVSRSDGAQHK